MPTAQMHTHQPTTTDAEAALVELHKLLHPEAHHEGADPAQWTAETIETIDTIVCATMKRLGLTPRTRR